MMEESVRLIFESNEVRMVREVLYIKVKNYLKIGTTRRELGNGKLVVDHEVL